MKKVGAVPLKARKKSRTKPPPLRFPVDVDLPSLNIEGKPVESLESSLPAKINSSVPVLMMLDHVDAYVQRLLRMLSSHNRDSVCYLLFSFFTKLPDTSKKRCVVSDLSFHLLNPDFFDGSLSYTLTTLTLSQKPLSFLRKIFMDPAYKLKDVVLLQLISLVATPMRFPLYRFAWTYALSIRLRLSLTILSVYGHFNCDHLPEGFDATHELEPCMELLFGQVLPQLVSFCLHHKYDSSMDSYPRRFKKHFSHFLSRFIEHMMRLCHSSAKDYIYPTATYLLSSLWEEVKIQSAQFSENIQHVEEHIKVIPYENVNRLLSFTDQLMRLLCFVKDYRSQLVTLGWSAESSTPSEAGVDLERIQTCFSSLDEVSTVLFLVGFVRHLCKYYMALADSCENLIVTRHTGNLLLQSVLTRSERLLGVDYTRFSQRTPAFSGRTPFPCSASRGGRVNGHIYWLDLYLAFFESRPSLLSHFIECIAGCQPHIREISSLIAQTDVITCKSSIFKTGIFDFSSDTLKSTRYHLSMKLSLFAKHFRDDDPKQFINALLDIFVCIVDTSSHTDAFMRFNDFEKKDARIHKKKKSTGNSTGLFLSPIDINSAKHDSLFILNTRKGVLRYVVSTAIVYLLRLQLDSGCYHPLLVGTLVVFCQCLRNNRIMSETLLTDHVYSFPQCYLRLFHTLFCNMIWDVRVIEQLVCCFHPTNPNVDTPPDPTRFYGEMALNLDPCDFSPLSKSTYISLYRRINSRFCKAPRTPNQFLTLVKSFLKDHSQAVIMAAEYLQQTKHQT